MTGVGTALTMQFTTAELASWSVRYAASGSSSTKLLNSTGSQTGQSILREDLVANTRYAFRLSLSDRANNTTIYSGNFLVASGTPSVSYEILLSTTTTTGAIATLGNTLKAEVEKFNQCKSKFIYTPVDITVNKAKYTIQVPAFQKSYVKQVVNAFTLLILDKVSKNTKLDPAELQEISKKFSNFLVVLKLIRDDDNSCKQNLSNYHISQFTKAMDEYGIYFK
jgi:hypothetical protein